MIKWLYPDRNQVPSPDVVAALFHFGELRLERVPWWAAHWLVGGYDGDHLVHLAGLHGDDPREVRDALPCALRDCGVLVPDSDVAAAELLFSRIAHMHLDGAVETGRVLGTAIAVLS